MTKRQQALILTCLVAVSAWLYGAHLDYVPAHLGWDEVFFGLNGHALATTGRDINGSFLPLYFHMGEGNIWYQPALAYAAALVFTLLPVTEATLRMPSVVMMPFYFMTTLLFVTVTDARPKWRYCLAALAFFLPLLVLVPWLRAHPSAYAEQVARYRVYDVHRFTLLQGIKEFLNYQNLTHRVSMYWGYIGPNYLFMSGAIKMSMTTRKVGVFLLACGVFLPVGIYQMLTKRRDWLGRLLIFGFATAPLAALLVDDPFAVDRELARR
jgi:hypothetical protein